MVQVQSDPDVMLVEAPENLQQMVWPLFYSLPVIMQTLCYSGNSVHLIATRLWLQNLSNGSTSCKDNSFFLSYYY